MPTHPASAHTDPRAHTARTAVQKAALVIGVVFLVIGVLGFVPGVTSTYDSFGAAGHESDAMLLGLFQVSALPNVVHLLLGAGMIALGLLTTRRAVPTTEHR